MDADARAAYLRRHYRYNLVNIASVHGAWIFGSSLTSRDTILPVFLAQLGASDFAIGVLPAAFMVTMSIPQLLAAHVTRRLPVKKVFFTSTHYPGALGLIGLGTLTWQAGDRASGLLVGATFAWLALYGLTISFAMPMWVNLQAKLYPDEVRGRGFSYTVLTGSVFGALGALTAASVLQRVTFPQNFGTLFLVAGSLWATAITAHYFLREPAVNEDAGQLGSLGEFLGELGQHLRESPDFAWLLVSAALSALAAMATAFYAVVGIERFSLSAAAAGQFGALLVGGKVVGSLIAGRVGDRNGFKAVALLAVLSDLAACTLALVAPSAAWHYALFVFVGMRGSCAMLGLQNLAIEFCPTTDKTSFVALTSTALCPAYVLGPLCGGLLAKYHPAGHSAVFVTAMVCSLAALAVLVSRVRDPRHQSNGANRLPVSTNSR